MMTKFLNIWKQCLDVYEVSISKTNIETAIIASTFRHYIAEVYIISEKKREREIIYCLKVDILKCSVINSLLSLVQNSLLLQISHSRNAMRL